MADRPIDGILQQELDPLLLRKKLQEFISKRLGKRGEMDAPLVIDAVEVAARAYGRLDADRREVINYRSRHDQLTQLSQYARNVALLLERLDLLSKDQVKTSCDHVDFPRLVSELKSISACSVRILFSIQKTGKPRDVIEELWIISIYQIYRTFFEVGTSKINVADFQRFLRLCLPAQFRGGVGKDHGALTPRQIERALKRHIEESQANRRIIIKT